MSDKCESCQKLHRRLQKAEAEVIKLQTRLNDTATSWESPERRIEAAQRDRQMTALDRYHNQTCTCFVCRMNMKGRTT